MYNTQFPNVDAFHAVSKAIAEEAEKYGAEKDRIHVVYSGLPLDQEAIATAKQNNVFQMVSIGRAHWKKGYTYALDACKLFEELNFKFNYTIVGAANAIEFAYQVHDLKLTNDVTLLDKLPYKEVQEVIKNADLLLLPSVEEGIANVVLEAMLNNTLVLTTDCGGMAEVIKDGDNGFSVPIRDPAAMGTKIIEIAALPQAKKTQLLKNAVQTIKKQHSEQHMVDQMLALYQSI
jgi:colanic acid/amylovoran biosynthesis glycosyltransferase